jgi:ketosteroid isomerase-like protein
MPDGNEGFEEAQEDVRLIDALLTRFQSAVAKADLVILRDVFSSDAVCVFTGKDGRVRGVKDVLDTWSRHLSSWTDVSVERRDTFVRIHGDTAWATFTWDGSGVADGSRYEVRGERWSVVALWEEGAWRFAQTHSSLPFSDWPALEVTKA